MPSFIGWIGSHPTLAAALGLLALFLLVNVLAYRHAHLMTRFAPAGSPTPVPGAQAPPGGGPLPGVALAPLPRDTPEGLGLAHQVHRFPGTVGELEAWHIPHPCARGIVLLFHGYKTHKAVLLPEARAFHDLGYACFLIDFPGSGGSSGNVTTIGYREADDVARAVAYAREHWGGLPLILYGQSMGSAAVLRAVAVNGVRADAAVLECPFDRLLTGVAARIAVRGLPAFPYATLLVLWGGMQLGFNGFTHNPVNYARHITCPVLLLHGSLDPVVTCRQMESIYRNLAGPKQLHSFPGVGHESCVLARPEEWKEWVRQFLTAGARTGRVLAPGGQVLP